MENSSRETPRGPGGSFRGWTEDRKGSEEPPGAPRAGRGQKDGGAPRPEEESTASALRELLRMSQGFADAGATEVGKLKGLLERMEEGLLAMDKKEQALLRVAEKAAGEREKLQTDRERTRKAGQQMRRDFLTGLQEESQRVASEATSQIEKQATGVVRQAMDTLEERLGGAIEATAEATREMQGTVRQEFQGVKRTTRELKGEVRQATGNLERAARSARQATWKSWVTVAAVAVLLPTLIVAGLTWMRPGWGLTDLQRSGMEMGTDVIERYNGIQQELQTSLDRIEILRSGTHPGTGRPLSEAQRAELRGQVMTQDEMQQGLEELKGIRDVMGWRPSQFTQEQIQQVKALQ